MRRLLQIGGLLYAVRRSVSQLSRKTVDLLDKALDQPTAAAVGEAFHRALAPLGVRALYVRACLSSGRAEHVYARISPPGWESFYAQREFAGINYLPREVRRRHDPFLWSEIVLRDERERGLARALVDNGFPDGLAVPCLGGFGYAAVVSLAFEQISALAPEERAAVELASLVLHNRMRALTPPAEPAVTPLSPRERDCVAFIADGKTDEDIASLLSISRTTVITHVNNVRLKLAVKTRSQAVAKCLTLGLI